MRRLPAVFVAAAAASCCCPPEPRPRTGAGTIAPPRRRPARNIVDTAIAASSADGPDANPTTTTCSSRPSARPASAPGAHDESVMFTVFAPAMTARSSGSSPTSPATWPGVRTGGALCDPRDVQRRPRSRTCCSTTWSRARSSARSTCCCSRDSDDGRRRHCGAARHINLRDETSALRDPRSAAVRVRHPRHQRRHRHHRPGARPGAAAPLISGVFSAAPRLRVQPRREHRSKPRAQQPSSAPSRTTAQVISAPS